MGAKKSKPASASASTAATEPAHEKRLEPRSDSGEWEKTMAKQEDEAAWYTNVEDQHKQARFATLKSKNDSGSRKPADSAELGKAPGAVAAAPAPTADGVTAEPAPTADGVTAEPAAATEPAPAASQLIERVIFVLGGPGSGKGTACEKLSARFNLLHLSVGDLLREEAKSGSAVGESIQQMMNEGQIVPLDITLDVVKRAIEKQSGAGKGGVLLDGFPRSVEQGEQFQAKVAKGVACLYFDCSEETMLQRLNKRAETSGRADDNEETMKKRLVTFNETTRHVIEFFSAQDLLRRLDAEQAPDEVLTQAVQYLEALGFQAH